ncbi:ferrous iron transport protein A [Streptomyces sp. NBC_00344]|uniref:ferrous iron transport protein A n=1 Tax=Streptomyces sp. NBC_00344 TaxID=2975720 RepID=UPI002E1F6365
MGRALEEVTEVDPYAKPTEAATIPVFARLQAPEGLATKRQLDALGLRPGGQDPVAEVQTRGPKNGLLYRIDLALPKRPMTLAKEYALDKAMAARQTCGICHRRYHYVLPTRLDSCLECHDGTPADPASYIAPPASHHLAA